MAKLFTEYDAVNDRVVELSMDNGTIIQRTKQNVQPVLDMNSLRRNDADISKNGIKQSWWQIGSIPVEVAQKWKIEEGFDILSPDVHPSEIVKRLRMAEFEKLRTTDAKF